MHGPHSLVQMLTSGTRLPYGDQWKAEKLAFWRWPITRCFIKSDSAGLFIEHSINFCLNGEHWRAVQYSLNISSICPNPSSPSISNHWYLKVKFLVPENLLWDIRGLGWISTLRYRVLIVPGLVTRQALIPQSKFSGPWKFTLRYQRFGWISTLRYRELIVPSLVTRHPTSAGRFACQRNNTCLATTCLPQ